MANKYLLLLSLLFSNVRACADHGDSLVKRYEEHLDQVKRLEELSLKKRGAPYPSGDAFTVPPLENIVPTDPAFSQNTLPVPTSFAPGTQPTLRGAPPIPTFQFVESQWPTRDRVPPTNSPEVQEWLKELEGHTIPSYGPNLSTDCSNTTVAQAFAERGSTGRCWWTCGGCTRSIDVTTCKNQWEYGHGYDDGPGLYTDKLLTYLDSNDLKATFYVVGSRVVSRPEIVVYEHLTGHQIAIHTWSHPALTTLTNEQIVAELGWTRKAIKDVTGVTPLFMRPPFGDIDDRVRAISLAMGLIPIIWSSVPNAAGTDLIQWDSQDWRVHAGNVQSVPNQQSLQQILDSSGQFDHGVVVLQHDIYVEAVNLAIGYTLPYVLNHNPKFTIKSVINCLGRPLEDSYKETNTNPESPAVSGTGDVATRSSNLEQGTFTGTGGMSTGSVGAASSLRVQWSTVGWTAALGAALLGATFGGAVLV